MINPLKAVFRVKNATRTDAIVAGIPHSSMDVRLQIAQLDKDIARDRAKFAALHKRGDPAAKAAFLTMKGLIAARCTMATKLLMVEYNKAATAAQTILEPVKEVLTQSSPVMQEQFEQLSELSFDVESGDFVLDDKMQAEYEAACHAIDEERQVDVKTNASSVLEPQCNVTIEVDDDA